MIYIKVDGEWYSTSYTSTSKLSMYESNHVSIAYDSEIDKVISNMIWDHNDGFKSFDISYDQVKLEMFLQGGKFHEWSMQLHRFGHNLTSDRINLNL